MTNVTLFFSNESVAKYDKGLRRWRYFLKSKRFSKISSVSNMFQMPQVQAGKPIKKGAKNPPLKN